MIGNSTLTETAIEPVLPEGPQSPLGELALEVVERARPVAVTIPSLDERVTAALAEAKESLPFADLRARCRVRAVTLHECVGLLAAAGRIVKTVDGYRLANP